MTASAGPALKDLYREHGGRVDFLTVYVREAHPGERYPQPDTFSRKVAQARAYQDRDRIPWTVAVDDVEGSFHRAVDPKPNSTYFVGTDGRIAFRTLWSNDEAGVREGFRVLLSGKDAPARGQSQAKLVPMMLGMTATDRVLGAAGPTARRDFRRALPPAYAMARIAGVLRPLPPFARAVASIGLLASAAGALGFLGWRAVRRPV